MRIKIDLISEKPIKLPTGYGSVIQGFVYNLIDKHNADWLHNTGFKYEKRQFRLFNFSEILEKAKYNPDLKTFVFNGQISFYISSPVDWILEQIAKNSVTKEKLMLGHFYLQGDKELIELAFDAGLGSRNSAGFGMIELVETRSRDAINRVSTKA